MTRNESVAFVLLNVKGRDLLAIDESNDELTDDDKKIYKDLGIDVYSFQKCKIFLPLLKRYKINNLCRCKDVESQKNLAKLFNINICLKMIKTVWICYSQILTIPTQTMESIVNYITSGEGHFNGITNWEDLKDEIKKHQEKGDTGKDKTISVLSWRKFYRLFRKTLERNKDLFSNSLKLIKQKFVYKNQLSKLRRMIFMLLILLNLMKKRKVLFLVM